jgi:XTP/dITP diphosphohydrolase
MPPSVKLRHLLQPRILPAMKKLVLASGNAGKLREFKALLAPLGWDVIPQSDLGVSEADEPHPTFVENALAKARHAAVSTGLPALADDSGICVAALAGAPGVYSARFAGAPKSDARNNALLVEKLAGEEDRRAHYVCVLAFVRHAEDPQPILAEGEWHGEIIDTPRGEGGFGYDAHFLLPQMDQTAAELEPALKNTLSHRGAACRLLIERLRQEG